MYQDPQFWVLIAFIIFIALVFNPIRKILTKSLDEKIDNIKNEIDHAEKLKKETQQILSDIKKRQNEVEKEIQIINDKSAQKIEDLKKLANSKLNEQIKKKNNLALNKIEQLTRETQQGIQSYITQISIEASINIIKKNLDKNDKEILVKQSVSELSSVLKN